MLNFFDRLAIAGLVASLGIGVNLSTPTNLMSQEPPVSVDDHEGHDHEGHDHEGRDHDGPGDDPLEASMPEGSDPITPEQRVAIEAFTQARSNWADTMVEMKAQQIVYNNDISERTEANQANYRRLRDKARQQMDEVFDTALEVFRLRKGDFETGSMLVTTLQYRESTSIYENSLEATEAMLETDLTFPFLYQMAARCSLLYGDSDKVMPYLQKFVELNGTEKLEKVDKMIANIVAVYPDIWRREQEVRAAEAVADNLPRVLVETTRGNFTLELFEDQAPNMVANFITLVESGYYDGSDFYQVVDDLIALGGDPVGDGTGTTGRYLPDEADHPDARQFLRGHIAMAMVPQPNDKDKFIPNSASSQFAIALMPLIRQDDKQTVFGRVIEGMEVVSTLRRVDPTEKKETMIVMPPDRIITAKVIRKRDHAYEPRYVGMPGGMAE